MQTNDFQQENPFIFNHWNRLARRKEIKMIILILEQSQ